MREWPPVLPVFGQITPFPATPLYDRLKKEGRLTRPKHWLEFAPFRMAHTPLKISVAGVQDEVNYAWTNSYSPAATKRALDSIADEPVPYKISHFVARIFFRGIYFPPKGVYQWLKLIAQNRAPSGTAPTAPPATAISTPDRYAPVNAPSAAKAEPMAQSS